MTKPDRVAVLTIVLLGASLAPLSSPLAGATSSPRGARGTSPRGITGTILLSGRMSSKMSLSMTGAFSVGHALTLDWDLPILTPVRSNGYVERVDSLSYTFDVPPASGAALTIAGRRVRRYHWNAPPADTVIHLLERLRVTVTSALSPFRSRAHYPLALTQSPRIATYARLTPLVRLPPSARVLAAELIGRRTTEQSVVGAVANWVASHTAYGGASSPGSSSASWVFLHHQGTCTGYANLMAGLLRLLGIPVQIVFGLVAATPVNLPVIADATQAIQWATPGSQGELHTWLNIYFPRSGWVPFDPQREKYFVDPRHIAFLTSSDAGALHLDAWSARSYKGVSPTGHPLSTGAVSIAPADGIGSKVTVQSRDDFHLALRSVQRDVSNVLLLSR